MLLTQTGPIFSLHCFGVETVDGVEKTMNGMKDMDVI